MRTLMFESLPIVQLYSIYQIRNHTLKFISLLQADIAGRYSVESRVDFIVQFPNFLYVSQKFKIFIKNCHLGIDV